jgi:peptidoglycan/xylan/chitin deacetylase (PgdA/CDA1 family)
VIARAAVLAAIGYASGCTTEIAHADEIYADGSERVLCGLSVDGTSPTLDHLEHAMVRAGTRSEAVILFAHEPGRTIAPSRVDAILALAARAGLETFTFPELADRIPRGGLVFAFDDAYVEPWFELRDIFARHAARVTFFVSNYAELDQRQRAMLHVLQDEGHAIEAHGMGHRNAPVYVERHGLAAYLSVEVDPLLELLARDGFHPRTFAYPYGDRTSELDHALLDRFDLIRSVTYLDRSVVNSAPCPR